MQDEKMKINFGAGPAALPAIVLKQASDAILNYNNSGLSILEIPHRSSQLFADLLAESKQLVLELAHLKTSEYEVLWLQGGGRLQFAMIPMNFLESNASAGYIDSGHWAFDAQEHARQFGTVVTLASTKQDNYHSVPVLALPIPPHLSYVHLTTNNTIYGTQLQQVPDCPVPLIADMSSDIFSEERDYSKYDLFYAVAQKNLGAAGVTLVVLRKNMLDKIVRKQPSILDYSQQVLSNSVLNTPPVFGIFVSLLTLRWIKEKTIATLAKDNKMKADLLYAEIDRNTLFEPIAAAGSRSKMNVVFRAVAQEIEHDFLNFARMQGIEGIAGHRSLGGFRASLYNAITIAQTETLVQLMQQFEQKKLKKIEKNYGKNQPL